MTRTLRVPILVLLPLLLVLGLVVEASTDEAGPTDVRVAELTPTAAAAGTLSSTWYCAAGSATGDDAGPAEQRVIVANASDAAATGTMTLYPEGAERTEVPVEVPANGRTEVVVSEHVTAAWAAALVEVTGGEITVAHSLTGPTGRSLSDCASSPSAGWYFPGGSTEVGRSMWIALFNPFPGEATVDLAFDTTDGARTPQDYQGIVVPGGTVVVRKVSDAVTLDPQVATTVSVRSGRVIAEQIQSLDGRDDGPKGLAATLGATAPSPIWSFPTSAPDGAEVTETVAVFNPGETDTEVLVQVQLQDPATHGTVEPFEISVPAHRYAVVDVSGDERVPDGVAHWIVVRAPDGSDIVAQRTFAGAGGGLTSSVGLPVVATRWLAPVAVLGSADDTPTSQVSVANPSATQSATITVREHGEGTSSDIVGATDLVLAPGERVAVDLVTAELTGGDSVEVVSDVPVVVGQWLAFATPVDIATPNGIPVAGTQSVPDDVVGPSVSGEVSTDGIGPSDTLCDPEAIVPGEDVTAENCVTDSSDGGESPDASDPGASEPDASSTTTTSATPDGG